MNLRITQLKVKHIGLVLVFFWLIVIGLVLWGMRSGSPEVW